MKKPHFDPTGAIRGGAYSVVITAVVLAILIALNVAVAALPASATEYDISASKLYSVTSNTKSMVNALTDDVTIYWIVQAGQEDAVIEMLDDTIPAFVDVERVEFSGAENYVIERDENGGSYRAGDVYYTENGEVLDTDSVNDFVTYIAALGLEDYYTYDATETELAETGLDEPELTVTIDYPESGEEDAEILTFTISFSRSATDKLTDWDEVLAALEEESEDAEETAEPTDEDAVAYLRVGESAIIYEIGYDTLKAIMACSYDDLRHTEIFPAEVEDVASLSVTLDGGTYEFTTTPPEGAEAEDEGTQWYYEGEETGVTDISTALAALSAREHSVLTGLTVISGGTEICVCEETLVRFRELTEREIERYIATGEPMDKAGAYGIQGPGGAFVSGITGDFYNVMGLPLCRLGLILRRLGVELI